MKKHIILLLLGLLFIFPSCNTLAPMLFGVREIHGYDAEQCEKFYRKLPKDFEFESLACNEAQYWQVSELGADSVQKKDLFQPLKIMYFHVDSLVSFHINCYCPPTVFFNLKWNYNHQFDMFPPTTAVPLEGYMLTLKDMKAVFPEIKGERDYTVLVFWTDMLHKVSRSEIKTVYRNLKKFKQLEKSEVYLINDDIVLSKSLKETE